MAQDLALSPYADTTVYYTKENVSLKEYKIHAYVYDLGIVNIPKIVHYDKNSNPSAGLTDNGIWKAFTSREGILWIGCTDPDGKIFRITPPRNEIPEKAFYII